MRWVEIVKSSRVMSIYDYGIHQIENNFVRRMMFSYVLVAHKTIDKTSTNALH